MTSHLFRAMNKLQIEIDFITPIYLLMRLEINISNEEGKLSLFVKLWLVHSRF